MSPKRATRTSPDAGAAGRDEPLREALAECCLRLGDDRLVLGHRLSEWCGHAPILEEDIALSNLALDLIGQGALLLERAGELEGRGRSADDLAYFRDVTGFRNVLLVEQPNDDFAVTIARQFLFDAFDAPFTAALSHSADEGLAAFAAKATTEATYHLRHSREWVVRLGDGTEDSHRRICRAFDDLWLFTPELFERDAVVDRLVAAGRLPDPADLFRPWRQMVAAALREAGLPPPPEDPPARFGGRRGFHGEAFGRMLDEMQSLARSHPGATW